MSSLDYCHWQMNSQAGKTDATSQPVSQAKPDPVQKVKQCDF